MERAVKEQQRGESERASSNLHDVSRDPSKSLQGTGTRKATPQPRRVAKRLTDGWLRLGRVEWQRLRYDQLGGPGDDNPTVELRGTGVQRRRRVPQRGINGDNDLKGSVCDSFAHDFIVPKETCSCQRCGQAETVVNGKGKNALQIDQRALQAKPVSHEAGLAVRSGITTNGRCCC